MTSTTAQSTPKARKPAIVFHLFGAVVGVQYPYRKTPDLYIALKGEPVFCAQCKATFPIAEFMAHVNSHDLRNKRTP